MPPESVTDQRNRGEAAAEYLLVEPHTGKLAILIAGLGALGTSAVANCLLARKRSQSATGQFTEVVARALPLGLNLPPLPGNLRSPGVPLADLEFGGWDVFPENALDTQRLLRVISSAELESIADEMEAVSPNRAVFYPEYVEGFAGSFFKRGSKAYCMQELMNDFRLLSRICGEIPVRGAAPSCDKGQFPWLRRCESHRIVWSPLGFCC